jgi:hypothetical protein
MDNAILIGQHLREKDDSRRFKERRTGQWNETYHLYRDKVLTNRLVQRQPVNIPIIRDTLQGWISKIDEEPVLKFETRGRAGKDRRGEIILNEMWNTTFDAEKLDIKDNIDKKVVGLQGRSFKYWYTTKGQIKCSVIDPYDIDVDPRVDPFDLNTAAFFNHKNLLIPLRRVLANKTYTPEGKRELKHFLDSKEGVMRAASSDEEYERRKERMDALGADNFDDYNASDVMVELNRSYKLLWDKEKQEFVRHLIVIALDSVILYNQPVEKAIGIDRLPFTTWASDPDLNDIWSDGVCDSVRTMNKVINTYFSQDIENRAYRNFGMYFYNTQNGQFKPQAFEAKPFGMYGVPGNPQEILQQMRIEPLADSMQTIDFLKNLIQSSVAQTPTERGVQDQGDTTLGEVQLSLQQSQTRQQVVAKQYRTSWEESGNLFYDLLNANSRGQYKLTKKAPNGDTFTKVVTSQDWKTPEGYEVSVVLKSEREANDDVEFKKTQFVKQSFIDNPVALKIAKRKELEILGWSEDEIEEVMQAEEQATAQPSPFSPVGPDGEVPVDPAVTPTGV